MSKQQIVVRDRRKPNHFRIQNVIFKEWLPIIGLTGYALYSFYVVLANHDEEMAFPGFQLLEGFLDISPGTIANYNRLLEWCELVEIQRFTLSENEPNHYYVLDEPDVTLGRLYAIRKNAEAFYSPGDPFLDLIVTRVEKWRPLKSYYLQRARPQVVRATQAEKQPTQLEKYPTSVVEYPTSVVEYPTSVVEYPTSLSEVDQEPNSNNQKQQGINKNQPTNNAGLVGYILGKMGVKEPMYTKLLEAYRGEEKHVLATAWWVVTDTWSTKPAGLFISRLELAAASGFYDLAQRFIEFSSADVLMLKQMAAKGEKYIEEWLNWQDDANYEGAAAAAYAIYQADKTWLGDELLTI